MKRNSKMLNALLIIAFLFIITASPALSATQAFSDGSAESIVYDLAIERPVGIVLTGLGCGVFVVALPFTVWSKERMASAGKTLVVKPGKATFVRPLGESLWSTGAKYQ